MISGYRQAMHSRETGFSGWTAGIGRLLKAGPRTIVTVDFGRHRTTTDVYSPVTYKNCKAGMAAQSYR
jgi:hypothetical protein